MYIAGDVADARRSLRTQCMEDGLCVTVSPTTFVYTGGAEDGVAVGFVNYPRFPTTPGLLQERARVVALRLIEDMSQQSALVVGPVTTEWLTRRKETQ